MTRTFPPGPLTPAERAALAATIRACGGSADAADWIESHSVPLPVELPRSHVGLGGGLGRVSRGRHGRATWTSDSGHQRIEAFDALFPPTEFST